jgi:hypothetical protein
MPTTVHITFYDDQENMIPAFAHMATALGDACVLYGGGGVSPTTPPQSATFDILFEYCEFSPACG